MPSLNNAFHSTLHDCYVECMAWSNTGMLLPKHFHMKRIFTSTSMSASTGMCTYYIFLVQCPRKMRVRLTRRLILQFKIVILVHQGVGFWQLLLQLVCRRTLLLAGKACNNNNNINSLCDALVAILWCVQYKIRSPLYLVKFKWDICWHANW